LDSIRAFGRTRKTSRSRFQQQRAIVSPLVPVIAADKFADCFPVMLLDCGEQMDAVEIDLVLSLPKPREVNSPDHGDDQAGKESGAKNHRFKVEIFRLRST
jgi:hypothetical protein